MNEYKTFITKFETIDSLIGILGVVIILIGAFVLQCVFCLEPCPLCYLQRTAFFGIGIALLMNMKYGNGVAHWALVILNTLMGLAISGRQILLHITSPVGFGEPILGLHLYTWSFLLFSFIALAATIMLLIYPERIHRE